MTQTISIADLKIHRIVEFVAPLRPALQMMPELTPAVLAANRHWLQPHSLDQHDVIHITYQSYIVKTPHHVVLVDSCIGNDKVRANPQYMRSDDNYMRALATAGVSVEDVDFVMCTHLHVDHVGWNTRLVNGRWVPTFPNARYIFSRKEYEAIKARHELEGYPAFVDSVLPIIEAGKADLVDDNYHLGDHVRLLPTPGHTAGHAAFCFGKGQDHAVMTGDLIHVPLQMRYPELSFERDKDPAQSAVTRRAFLERFCDTPTLCCTAHFPAPSVGHIRRWGSGYRLENTR